EVSLAWMLRLWFRSRGGISGYHLTRTQGSGGARMRPMNRSLLDSPEVRLIAPLLPNGAVADADSPRDAGSNNAAWDRLLQELQRSRTLGDDWDGQGALAPAAGNVDWASDWVCQMRRYPQAIPPSRAVAGVGGEVYLEWQGAAQANHLGFCQAEVSRC